MSAISIITFAFPFAGKYIVCGEAMSPSDGETHQASCFETNIEKVFDNGE